MSSQNTSKIIKVAQYPLEYIVEALNFKNKYFEISNPIPLSLVLNPTDRRTRRRLWWIYHNQTCVICETKATNCIVRFNIKSPYFRCYLTIHNENGTEMTLDHIIPRSLGGKDNKANFQTLCYKCNQRKGNTNEITPTARIFSDIFLYWQKNREKTNESFLENCI